MIILYITKQLLKDIIKTNLTYCFKKNIMQDKILRRVWNFEAKKRVYENM